MENRNQFEYVGFALNIRETKSAKGWIYSLSIPIVKQEGNIELKEYMNGAIFSKDQIPGLIGNQEIHLVASLTVNAAYQNKPQTIGFFGFDITPIFGKVWKSNPTQKKEKEKVDMRPLPDNIPDHIPDENIDGSYGFYDDNGNFHS